MVQSAARSASAASSCNVCPRLRGQAFPPRHEELQERESHLAAMARLVEHLHNQQVHGRLPMRVEVEDEWMTAHRLIKIPKIC